VLIVRVLYAKHKEFGKNEASEADALLALYLGFLFVNQLAAATQKSNSAEFVPQASVLVSLTNFVKDFLAMFILQWAFGSSILL
jgi:hypothetical protein